MIGIVIETHPTQKLRPKMLLTHTPERPAQNHPMVLDMSTRLTDERGTRLEVRRVPPGGRGHQPAQPA